MNNPKKQMILDDDEYTYDDVISEEEVDCAVFRR